MRILYIIILSCIITSSFAQDSIAHRLEESEEELKGMFDLFYTNSESIDKDMLADSIRTKFREALSVDGSFGYAWNKLDKIGKIESADKIVRVFTWHQPVDKDQYVYYGFIQVNLKKEKSKFFQFQDNLSEKQRSEKLDQSFDNWNGKLYYSIIVNRYKRHTFYTLLGMDYNNSMSNLKTIETMTIKRNQPEFTTDMYLDGTDQKDRIVLEYSSQVAISVRYNNNLNQIVFDHLVPLHPVYSGNYEFYGPDGSYDGLEFTDGVWIIRQDVDARNLY